MVLCLQIVAGLFGGSAGLCRSLWQGLIAGIFFGFIPIVAGITNLLTLESVSKAWVDI